MLVREDLGTVGIGARRRGVGMFVARARRRGVVVKFPDWEKKTRASVCLGLAGWTGAGRCATCHRGPTCGVGPTRGKATQAGV